MTAILHIYTVLMITTGIGAVGANLILLLLFASHLKLRTDTWALTLNLSLCDLIFGICVIPAAVYSSLLGGGIFSKDEIACKLLGFIFVLLQVASLNSLVWATVDKFTEICFPLRYAQMITKKRIWIILVLLWIYALVVSAFPLIGFGKYSFSSDVYMCVPLFNSSTTAYGVMLISGGVLAPILTISVLYIAIIHIARNQAKRGTFVCNDQHCYYVPIRSYFKNTVILIVSAVYLLVCWIPSVTISFYEIFYAHNVPIIVKMASIWLLVLTSGINPWVNTLAQRKYRKALRESWRKLKRLFEDMSSSSEPPSENERHSSIQSHQCLPGHNMTNSIQT
ncbi:PREDICTED: rhodopsin, GQ-coupled-like [Nanorana parkeri]|uniref:rhodopsin, GQ-coupled-like n=1 Tax=Nanorana parkeri TaxID=125878 RepID=UPI000854CE19|nr:PREDICTED: rhodopsin, GQ-coupled-like [Nanorana parkeri]XP_018414781.1 PREDICTED: rhodopsin, GQ-coupled-like [Nanorana parkeri]